jgi:prepilin-type processing-associated H-X9-DG protein
MRGDHWNGSVSAIRGVMGLAQGSWLSAPGASSTAITKPAETIMLASRNDGQRMYGTGTYITGVNWWDGAWAGGGMGNLIPDGGTASGDSWDMARDGSPYKSQSGLTYNQNNHDGGISTDNGQAVFVFADGHAKSMKPVQTNPNDAANPEKNMWDAYRN